MMQMPNIADPNTYKLLTPGPLTTTLAVREAMLVDRCTWDDDYKAMTESIRASLLELAEANPAEYGVVLMQGSGTFGVESVLSSVPGAADRVLVLVNGAYSERMCQILTYHRIPFDRIDCGWDETPDAQRVAEWLDAHPETTMVSMVHSETTTGILNDIESVARVVKAKNRLFIVDAMSSFGGVEIPVESLGIDFLVSSANKCIQGVPGFSFIIARKSALLAAKGNARSLSLDLTAQYETLEKDHGKWRFTSPTHVVAAFDEALRELKAEGGIAARHARYAAVNEALREGMAELGFKAYVAADRQGPSSRLSFIRIRPVSISSTCMRCSRPADMSFIRASSRNVRASGWAISAKFTVTMCRKFSAFSAAISHHSEHPSQADHYEADHSRRYFRLGGHHG